MNAYVGHVTDLRMHHESTERWCGDPEGRNGHEYVLYLV